jgi:hypothetical protein
VILGCYGNDDPANTQGGLPPSPVEIHSALNMAYRVLPVINAGTLIDPGGSTQNVSYLQLENASGGPVTLTGTPTVPSPESAGALPITINTGSGPLSMERDLPRLLILENISTDAIEFQGDAAEPGSNLLIQGGTASIGQYGKLTLMWSPAAQKWVELSRALTPT